MVHLLADAHFAIRVLAEVQEDNTWEVPGDEVEGRHLDAEVGVDSCRVFVYDELLEGDFVLPDKASQAEHTCSRSRSRSSSITTDGQYYYYKICHSKKCHGMVSTSWHIQ